MVSLRFPWLLSDSLGFSYIPLGLKRPRARFHGQALTADPNGQGRLAANAILAEHPKGTADLIARRRELLTFSSFFFSHGSWKGRVLKFVVLGCAIFLICGLELDLNRFWWKWELHTKSSPQIQLPIRGDLFRLMKLVNGLSLNPTVIPLRRESREPSLVHLGSWGGGRGGESIRVRLLLRVPSCNFKRKFNRNIVLWEAPYKKDPPHLLVKGVLLPSSLTMSWACAVSLLQIWLDGEDIEQQLTHLKWQRRCPCGSL